MESLYAESSGRYGAVRVAAGAAVANVDARVGELIQALLATPPA
jgi:hypothetical protein